MPEKFQPSEKVTIMNFDKGWSRLEKVLFIIGILICGLVFYNMDIRQLQGYDGVFDVDDAKKCAFVGSLFFIPWLAAKFIKWIIDGFRG